MKLDFTGFDKSLFILCRVKTFQFENKTLSLYLRFWDTNVSGPFIGLPSLLKVYRNVPKIYLRFTDFSKFGRYVEHFSKLSKFQ